MSVESFNEWLDIVNVKMIDEGRIILLIIDNALVHKLNKEYSNISLLFLPPNTSAIIQPLDQGIAKSIKSRFRVKLNNFLIAHMDDINPLKKINILDPILWLMNIWKEMDDSVLYNCWGKSGLIHQSELLGEEEVDNITNQLNIEEEKGDIVFDENVMGLLDTLLIDYDFNEENCIEDEDILRVQEFYE